jgi:hypothetical protein
MLRFTNIQYNGHLDERRNKPGHSVRFFNFPYLSMGLKRNQVHCHCGYLLAYGPSPVLQMVIVEQLVEWMSGRGNRSTHRKPAQVPLCPSQFPYDMTRDRTRAASRRLTA